MFFNVELCRIQVDLNVGVTSVGHSVCMSSWLKYHFSVLPHIRSNADDVLHGFKFI